MFNGKRYRTVLSNAVLVDKYGEVAFSIWDEWQKFFRQNKKQGHSYLAVKSIGSGNFLSTCSETSGDVLPDEDEPDVEVLHLAEELKITQFDSVNKIIFGYKCRRCEITLTTGPTEIYATCQQCAKTVQVSVLTKSFIETIEAAILEDQPFNLNLEEIFQNITFEANKSELRNNLMSKCDIKVRRDDRSKTLIVKSFAQ